jgi:predicted negative regulator of RcsB-dependent stress response
LTRHELKSRDEITTKLQSFTELALSKTKEILIGAGVVAVIALAIVGWRYYSAGRNAAAQSQLGAVIAAYSDTTSPSDKDRYTKAMAEAQKVVDSYPGTRAAAVAKYFSGLSQEGLGDTAKAVQTLQDLFDHGDADLKGVSGFALAGIYNRHGETPKAIDMLKKMSESGAYSKSAVVMELGKILEASNKRDEAKGYYDKIVLEYSDSPLRDEAEAGLKRMGFPIPTPPPPAAKPS